MSSKIGNRPLSLLSGLLPISLASSFLAGMEHGKTVGLERGHWDFVVASYGL